MRSFNLLLAPALVLALALPFVLAGTAALAACPETTILSCPIGKKQLEVCLTGPTATYSFGPRGRPELVLSDRIETLDYTPWNGIGRAIWETVVFHNGPVSYEVWASIDRMDRNAAYEGGVSVLKNGNQVALLRCNPGSRITDFAPLSDAKAQAGLCWDMDVTTWVACARQPTL